MAKSTNKKGKEKRVVKEKQLVRIKALEDLFDIEIVKRPLQNGQYITQEFEKRGIFIHHTAGTTAEGAMSWWDQTPDRVGTPYVIDRDGTIYECFDPSYWAYHLGIRGDDNRLEKETVNIELVSAGWLKNGYFYPLYPNLTSGKKIPEEEIVRTEFRGYNEWHKYTDAQIKSLCKLIAKISVDFPTIELPDYLYDLYKFDQTIIDEAEGGIWSHANVREDKTDLFPQPNLVTEINKTLKLLKG
tara:strand:+ start:2635 stop:3363 length:729 start_codon:yes stop_codon:yes gene_type:complete